LKDVLGTLFGIVFFKVKATPQFIIGITLSLAGALHYSYAKYKTAVAAKDHEKA
jgi:hypothetical protein